MTRLINKYFLIIIIGMAAVFHSCKSDNPPKDNPSGISQYTIRNISDYQLNIVFTKSSNLGGGVDDSKTVDSNKSLLFFEDNILGKNPLPDDTFTQLVLRTSVNNILTQVYIQNPIDNDSWFITSQSLSDDMIGLTKYEIVISNEDLIF